MNPAWAIAVDAPEREEYGRALADRSGQPLVATDSAAFPFLLVVTPDHLELRRTGPNAPGPLHVDFTSGAMRRRLQTLGKRSPLGKALGFSRTPPGKVVDATAGLGQDGFVIAALGRPITLVERCLPFFLLLEDALARAASHPDLAAIVQRIELIHADARHWLAAQPTTERPDVVYLDPMYPPRTKSALSGKPMQLAQQLAGRDDDADELLEAALICARQRVAVKRPGRAPALANRQPDFAITGRKTRYDVYLCRER